MSLRALTTPERGNGTLWLVAVVQPVDVDLVRKLTPYFEVLVRQHVNGFRNSVLVERTIRIWRLYTPWTLPTLDVGA